MGHGLSLVSISLFLSLSLSLSLVFHVTILSRHVISPEAPPDVQEGATGTRARPTCSTPVWRPCAGCHFTSVTPLQARNGARAGTNRPRTNTCIKTTTSVQHRCSSPLNFCVVAAAQTRCPAS
jgi:hypothetical protein